MSFPGAGWAHHLHGHIYRMPSFPDTLHSPLQCRGPCFRALMGSYLRFGGGGPLGETVGFWIASKLGHDFVASKLKLGGAGVIKNTRFGFSVVFLLGLIPVMPVTVIN